MRLDELTDPAMIEPALAGADRQSVLYALVQLVAGHVPVDSETLFGKLEQREALGSTAIGRGIAVPHCKVAGIDRVVMAVGISVNGIDFGADDDQPVRVFFLVVSPERQPAAHLTCLAAIARWVRSDEHLERLLELEMPGQIYDLLAPAEPEPEPE